MNQNTKQMDWLQRTDTIGAVVGAALGWLMGGTYLDNLIANPIAQGMLIRAFGTSWTFWLTTLNIIAGASIGFFIMRTVQHYFAQAKMSTPEQEDSQVKHYALPEWIFPRTAFSITLGEEHKGEGYILNPTWCRLPEKGTYGGIVAFGGIGSGKTASVANPIMHQIMEFKPHDVNLKIGGLVLDVKGDFVEYVKKLATEFDRSNDLVIIKPNGNVKWNPIDEPKTPPETLAGRLLAVYQNVTTDSGQGDQAWVAQGVLKLLTHVIGVLRELQGYITLHDCNSFIADIASGELDDIETALTRWGDNDSVKETERLEHHRRFFTHEWTAESDRSRGIVVSATKNVTGLFSVPEVKNTFSPNQNEITFAGFDGIIDNGQIVAIDLPESQYGVLANAVGTLLKLSFQRSALSRVARAKQDQQTNTSRTLFFICDEYQKFVSCAGSAGEGDEQFYALSRQSKCFNLVLTQSPQSIISKVGEDAANVMFASLRTKLFLAMINPGDATLAAETLGEDWQDVENLSFTETVQSASFNPVDASISGTDASVAESRQLQQQRRYLVEPVKITQLRTFECYATIFDGIKQRPPVKLYLKTDFVPDALSTKYNDPREMPHNELLTVLEQEAEQC